MFDPCEEAVERFLKWELDLKKRRIAMDASLPRLLNRDVLTLLTAEAEVHELFDWLKSRSFVVEHSEGWQYHNLVREPMLRYQRKVSPHDWTTLHNKLAAYYDQVRQRLGSKPEIQLPGAPASLTEAERTRLTKQQETLQADWDIRNDKLTKLRQKLAIEAGATNQFQLQQEIQAEESQRAQLAQQLNKIEQMLDQREEKTTTAVSAEPKLLWQDETWQKYTLEWLYHCLCVAPQAQFSMALNGWLGALKHSRKLAHPWAVVMIAVGNATNFVQVEDWGKRLRDGLQAHDDDNYDLVIGLFFAILQSPQLEAKWRSVALHWRGYTYRLANQYELSLPNLTKAITLAPDEPEYWLDRGETYRQMERYPEALTDLNRAIKLKPDYQWALTSRGQVYRSLERYKEALTDFNRAIELNANYKWAIQGRGETLLLVGQLNQALADFTQRITLDSKNGSPKQVRMHCSRGQNTTLHQHDSPTSWKTITSFSRAEILADVRCN